jgi:phenol hydroxylase P4 protein
MPVKAIAPYSFPSRSRAELYGDDQLVHVLWRDNTFLCAAATFRVPQGMPFSDFLGSVVEPWASSDPDFVPGTPTGFQLDLQDWQPDPARGLRDNGIGHKSLVSFVTGPSGA